MHNLTKIKIFRIALYISYPLACLIVFPFALLKRKKTTSIFFLLDRYAIGGAQRIHLDILTSIQDIPKYIYFTRKSPNDKLKHAFYSIPNSNSKDIHFWCDNLLFRLFSVHYYSFYINRHPQALVFSSNSTFFYDTLPFLKENVRTIELLHNFSYGKKGMEFFGLANHIYLDNRIVYDSLTLSNIKNQYEQYGIPQHFFHRVLYIEPGVDVPSQIIKQITSPLKVIYAGRGGPQKRVWLISRIAEYFIQNKIPVEFHIAGPAISELSQTVRENAVIHGEIGEQQRLNEIYSQCHVLLLTSAYEGFPMVIKESMAYGCVPVVTALPGNLTHLSHLQNSLLIREINDEQQLVAEAINNIKLLVNDFDLTSKISSNAYDYAKANFRKDSFLERYRELLTRR